LLLRCIQVPPDPAAIRRAIDGQPLDWPALVERATLHRVSLLVYEALARADRLAVLPPAVRQLLQVARRAQAAQTTWLRHWRRRVLACLSTAGIPTIVLKGGYLAEAVYPAPQLRPMVDLDLLVPRQHHEAARQALAELGYRGVETYNYGEEHNLALGKDTQLVAPRGRGVPVELHWDLIRRAERQTEPDLDRIWRQARPWTVDGVGVLAMSPEDLLLHLCLHLASEFHSFEQLLWFSDIDALLRHPNHPLDWPRLIQMARADQAARAVYTTLLLCRELLETPVPPAVLAALAPPAPVRWVIQQALPPASLVRDISTTRRLVVKYALVDSGWRAGRLVREHLLPAPLTLRGAYKLRQVPAGPRLIPVYLRHLATVLSRFLLRVASVVARGRASHSTDQGRE
jgi:hypothetical protein